MLRKLGKKKKKELEIRRQKRRPQEDSSSSDSDDEKRKVSPKQSRRNHVRGSGKYAWMSLFQKQYCITDKNSG